MGVPGLRKSMKAVFGGQVFVRGGKGFDHVYIDLNGYIHIAANKAVDEETLFRALFKKLDSLLKRLQPKVSVYLVVDGYVLFVLYFTLTLILSLWRHRDGQCFFHICLRHSLFVVLGLRGFLSLLFLQNLCRSWF